MKLSNTPIYFYFPHEAFHQFENIHKLKVVELWKLLIGHPVGVTGIAHWVLQTYYYLRKAGWSCTLVPDIPKQGIVFTHRDFLPVPVRDPRLISSRKLTVVSMKVDRGMYHPADFNIVHNPQDASPHWHRLFIPPWPQIALLPRIDEPEKPALTIGYVGNKTQLAPFFNSKDWIKFLQDHNLKWVVRPPQEWNNYSDIDILIGIRRFEVVSNDLAKPPLKLFNAWLAGIPIIVSPESAYAAYRTNPYDFCEVRTPEEVKSLICRFIKDPVEYSKYVNRAIANRKKVSP